MLLTVRLVQKQENALMIPEESLIPIQDRHYVYRVDEANVAHRVEIRVGRRRPGFVEVTSGLSEGDRVVTQGVIKVRPGDKVVLKSESSPAGPQGTMNDRA